MGDNKNRLSDLENRVSNLLRRQFELQKDLNALNLEIKKLQLEDNSDEIPAPAAKPIPSPAPSPETPTPVQEPEPTPATLPVFDHVPPSKARKAPKNPVNWEKLIGENIINKIGIIITVIGVAIGANYVIENELISPTARILIGYVFSFGLAGVAYRLRKKYLNYSAVLLGGAMASMYLLTYAAYTFYGLIPQLVTFLLMTVITLVTVGAALGYNHQWVSVFGLVGGYAVPFLVGGEEGSTLILFSYVLFINLGVLLVALHKYWRLLFLSAFGFTWLIFLTWFFAGSPEARDVEMSFLFSTAYFLLFYAAFLIYKVREQKDILVNDISTLLTNTAIYFSVGFGSLNYGLDHLQGLFTVYLAAIHFGVGQIIRKYEMPSKIMQNFVNGLVLIFLTLAIPIQFTDKWITMAWSLEAVLLLWMGRVKKQSVFEVLAYPLLILSVLSFIGYAFWFNWDFSSRETLPFANQLVLTFLIFWGSFVGIQYLLLKYKDASILKPSNFFHYITRVGVPFVVVTTLFWIMFTEISRSFYFWKYSTILEIERDGQLLSLKNPSIDGLKSIWLLNYSIAFVFLGSLINKKWFHIPILKSFTLAFSILLMLIFFSTFFDSVFELRQLYLGEYQPDEHQLGLSLLLVRYVLIAFGVLNMFTLKKALPDFSSGSQNKLAFELFVAFTTIFLVSSELIQWLDLGGFENSYKLGLSILWGVCSLTLILLGIFKQKAHLRLGAMVVFSITLLKLFFYDISHLSTISKTIVFLALGILLLVISYLYNRFKDRLSEEESIELET